MPRSHTTYKCNEVKIQNMQNSETDDWHCCTDAETYDKHYETKETSSA